MTGDDADEVEGRAQWQRWADELEAGLPRLGSYPISGLVRRARRLADLSQRDLARRAGISQSTVGRVESGTITPSLAVFDRLLVAAGLSLVVVDGAGRVVLPMRDSDDVRDGGGRRYPSHLDAILDPRPGEWWGDGFGIARPPETFYRDRARRDALRRRAVWQVRITQNRRVPEPPDPDIVAATAAALERRRQAWLAGDRPIPELDPGDVDWGDE